jgi:transposase-like protein
LVISKRGADTRTGEYKRGERMPARIPDNIRAAILTDIQAGTLGNREIARKHGVAPSTVTKLAKDGGVDTPFERSQTEKATVAAVHDAIAERAETVRKLHRLGTRALEMIERCMDELTPMQLVTVMGVSFDKHTAMTKIVDSDEQTQRETAARHAQQLAAALRLAAHRLKLTPEQEEALGPALRDAVTALTGETS